MQQICGLQYGASDQGLHFLHKIKNFGVKEMIPHTKNWNDTVIVPRFQTLRFSVVYQAGILKRFFREVIRLLLIWVCTVFFLGLFGIQL